MHTLLSTALAHRDDLPWLHDPGLHARLEHARTAWPGLSLPPEVFVARLVDVLEQASPAPSSFDAIRPDEQALVAACLAGLPAATSRLESHAFGTLGTVARRFHTVVGEEELVQRVRAKLLTAAPPRTPQLAGFTGATSLARWIRVIAVRTALDIARADGRRQARERALPQALPQRDPEFYWMRQLYTEDFERILQGRLQALSSRDRNLLRAQVTHGMSLEDMARMWNVHRATIARWLRAARLELLTSVRQGLQAEAGLSDSEVDSVMELIRSAVSEGVIARGLATKSP